MTCPLVDYLAWLPFTLATVVAAVTGAVGLLLRSRAVLAKAPDVFGAVIVAGSVVAVVAILAVQGTCP